MIVRVVTIKRKEVQKVKTISVRGDIIPDDYTEVYEYYGIDGSSPKTVNKALNEANGDDIIVEINSGGGDLIAGSEIYSMLKKYSGNVETHIMGMAASAASIIAMAGRCLMGYTAMLMIHNVSSYAEGDYKDMSHMSQVLQTANKSVAAAYREKTGMDEKTLLDLMNKETYMTAEQAVANKFADGYIGSLRMQNGITTIDYAKLDAMKNSMKKSKALQAQINLLKLKGEMKHV